MFTSLFVRVTWQSQHSQEDLPPAGSLVSLSLETMRDPSEMGELFNQLAEMAKGKSAFLLHLQICRLNLVL